MKNPFSRPAPATYRDFTDTITAGTVPDQMDIVRAADAQKLREILAWPGTGTTIRKAAASRLRRLEKAAK
jgi:hypothetical protein